MTAAARTCACATRHARWPMHVRAVHARGAGNPSDSHDYNADHFWVGHMMCRFRARGGGTAAAASAAAPSFLVSPATSAMTLVPFAATTTAAFPDVTRELLLHYLPQSASLLSSLPCPSAFKPAALRFRLRLSFLPRPSTLKQAALRFRLRLSLLPRPSTLKQAARPFCLPHFPCISLAPCSA